VSGFSNPIIGGGGALVYPSIHSPGFITGISGWTIKKDGSAEFNNLTIRGTFLGTDFIVSNAGAFFYSGAPANGNLFASIASVSGTDAFGNAYGAGLNIGDQAAAHFGVGVTGRWSAFNASDQPVIRVQPDKQAMLIYSGSPALGNLIISAAAAAGTDDQGNAFPAGIYDFDAGTGNTVTVAGGAVSLSNTNSSNVTTAASLAFSFISSIASLVLTSPTDPFNTLASKLYLRSAASPAAYAVLSGLGLYAESPGTTGTLDQWNSMAARGYQNSWADSLLGPSGQYRLLASPPNSVELIGDVSAGTRTDNTVIVNLPNAYHPATTQSHIKLIAPAVTAAANARLFINTNGNVECEGISGLAAGNRLIFHDTYSLDA